MRRMRLRRAALILAALIAWTAFWRCVSHLDCAVYALAEIAEERWKLEW
jgi:hypothetical protein